MTKKLLAMVLTCVMTGSLAACNSGAAAPPATEAEMQADILEEEDTEKPENIAVGSVKNIVVEAGTELKITTTYGTEEPKAELYRHAVQEWMKKTGCIVQDSSATADEMMKSHVIADFEAGAEADVLFWFTGNDANPFIEADRVVSIEEIRTVYPDYAQNMKESMLDATASPADGVSYAVPFYGYWEGLYVNKKVCEAAGVEIPGADTTWKEFLEICQQIKDAGFTPIAVSLAKEPHYWFEFAVYNHTSPGTHNTVPVTIDDSTGRAWVEGLQDIKDLYQRGFLSANANTAEASEVFRSFIDGKCAFYLDGSWKAGAVTDEEGNAENFTVTYVPGARERKATDIIGGLSSGWYISRKAWNDEQKRAAAVSFITDITADESVSVFAGVSATALKNGAELDKSTLNQVQIDSLDMTGGATAVTGAVQDLMTQNQRAPIFEHMPEIVTGEISIEMAVQQVIDKLVE
ncbi:MAG: extracellular solute-binding protein [Eubacteriales bacterium]|nr:extracellular solute-binding protein [Eubacteriales bacterium]